MVNGLSPYGQGDWQFLLYVLTHNAQCALFAVIVSIQLGERTSQPNQRNGINSDYQVTSNGRFSEPRTGRHVRRDYRPSPWLRRYLTAPAILTAPPTWH